MDAVNELVTAIAEPLESLLSLFLDAIEDLLEDVLHLLRRLPRALLGGRLIGVCSPSFDLSVSSHIQLRLDSALGLDLGERSWGSGGLILAKIEGFCGLCGEKSSDEKLRFVCLHDLSLLG